jgi:hypothetical protein
MALLINGFTTTANTTVTADSNPPATPHPASLVLNPNPLWPHVDGSSAYIWSTSDTPMQMVTFESTFTAALPIITAALPIFVTFSYFADLSASANVTLEFLNVLGIVVATVNLFTVSNGTDNQNVAIGTGDFLLGVSVGATSVRATVTTTVTAGTGGSTYPFSGFAPGGYLGELRLDALVIA